MWVWRTWPVEKRISRCLRFGSTMSTVDPRTCRMGIPGSLTFTPVTCRPPIHFCSVAAVRKMVSPSGIPHKAFGTGHEGGRFEIRPQLVREALDGEPLDPAVPEQAFEGADGRLLPRAVEAAQRHHARATALDVQRRQSAHQHDVDA